MNYNSMQELINASQTNMIYIINQYDDDGAYNILSHIPSWVKVGNKTVSSSSSAMYYSNSYFLFNNVVDIYFNNRDGCRQSILKEEGLINHVKFFKLRFIGASRYGSVNISSYKMIYDIVFVENGEFMIYVEKIPSNYFTGDFYIRYNNSTLSYNKPTSSSRYISFIYNKTSDNFTVNYKILDAQPSWARNFILTNNEKNILYYFNNDSLTSVSGSLTANNIKEYGFDLSVLQKNLSKILNFNGKLCYWVEPNEAGETAYNKVLNLNALPKPQFLTTETITIPKDLNIKTILGNERATDLMFLFDDSSSWEYIDNEGNWQTLDKELEGEGTLISNLNKFKDKIETRFKNANNVKIRYRLDSADDYIVSAQFVLE